jgi:hypothetical protein
MKTGKAIASLTSGRVVVVPPTEVSEDRYEFLLPGEAEPNLGTAPAGSVLTTNELGDRIWSNSVTVDTSNVNTVIAGNVYTTGLFHANGSPYVTSSNIYNGSAHVATDLIVIDYAPIAGTTTVRWLLSATDHVNNRFKFSTIDCINNGTAAVFTEYAVLLSDPAHEVANYASDVTTGNIDLYAIGDSANVTITYQRTTLGSATHVGYILQ